MLKIPLQIYLDQESIATLKKYSKLSGKSVSALAREAIDQKAEELKTKLEKEAKNEYQKRQEWISSVKEFSEKFKGLKDHHPDKTNDELLYGE